MEDKIEFGEYVRTKSGEIGKIIVDKDDPLRYVINEYGQIELHADIVKHSKNIIDLIEVGDYVNGMEVYKGKVASGKEKLLVGNHTINGMALELVDIKSIVTKEQLDSMKYITEEDK